MYLYRIDRILSKFDILCFILALLVWQGKFDSYYINILFGLVLANGILLLARFYEDKDLFNRLSFLFILLSIFIAPLGWNSIADIVLIGVCIIFSIIFKPKKEFFSGFFYAFWIFAIIQFYQIGIFTGDYSIKGIFKALQGFAVHPDGISHIMSEWWWLFVSVGYGVALIPNIKMEWKERGNPFLFCFGIFSFPILAEIFIGYGICRGIYDSIFHYICTLRTNNNKESDSNQVAYEKYIFRVAFIDFKRNFQESFLSNMKQVQYLLKEIKIGASQYGWFVNIFVSMSYLASAITLLTLGNVITLLLLCMQIILLVLYGLPNYIFFLFVWGLDNLYRKRNGVYVICPSCHTEDVLPTYACPECQRRHNNVIPGRFGILKRKCICGTKIPVAYFNGRKNLEAFCKQCETPIVVPETKPICIPIIGGPQVGKTCFLSSATIQLIQDIAPQNNWTVSFTDEDQQRQIEHVSTNIKQWIAPSKTVKVPTTACNLLIENRKWSVPKMLYLYDPAGEWFDSVEDIKKEKFHENRHGNILIIDPFTISNFTMKHEEELQSSYKNMNIHGVSAEEILDRFLMYVQEIQGTKVHEKLTEPLAVVINKIDVCNLQSMVGKEAALELMKRRTDLKSMDEAVHILCKDMLTEYGMGNFLRKLENKFPSLRFFACSSFHSEDTYKPILWLLSQVDKDLKVIRDGGQKHEFTEQNSTKQVNF